MAKDERNHSPKIAGDTGHADKTDTRNFEDECIASFSDNDSDNLDNAKPGTLTLNQQLQRQEKMGFKLGNDRGHRNNRSISPLGRESVIPGAGRSLFGQSYSNLRPDDGHKFITQRNHSGN